MDKTKKIINEILQDREIYIDKINEVAGYFDKDKFANFDYKFDEDLISLVAKEINLKDFSPFLQKLCDGDYSKFLLITFLSYCVEI